MSRVTEDLEDFITAVPLVVDVLRAGVVIVLSAAGFLALDWRLALAFLVVFPIYGFSLRLYLPRAARLYAEERRLAAERGRVMLESLHGRSTVHAYRNGPEVLKGVDVVVPAGTSLALVGGSGAGKTTLANIVAGTFPATSGQLTLTDPHGAVSVVDLDQEVLRDWVGVISQETHVFTGSLRDDLSYAAPDSEDEQIVTALKAVRADAWVKALPQGLDTQVGPGEHPLAAAQVQQLALARPMLRDPAVVVLDEATAEAGSVGARDLEGAAAALVAGRTAVVVAHRLPQARGCDRIAVLAEGHIAESGTHDELIARGGRYAALWKAWSRS